MPWKCHGSVTEMSWDLLGPTVTTQCSRAFIRATFTTLAWENHGDVVGLSWDCHRTVVGLSWDCHGTVTGLSWYCHGTVMGLSWTIHGAMKLEEIVRGPAHHRETAMGLS